MAVSPAKVAEYVQENDRHDVIRASCHTVRRQFQKIPGIRDPSIRLSGKLWGTRTGISNTVQGRVCNDIAARNSTIDRERVDWERVTQLEQDKFTVLEDHFDDDLIETISEKFDQYIEDDETSVIRGRHGDHIASRCIHDPTPKIPELRQLIDDHVLGIAEGFFDAHFRPANFQCLRNYHVPDEVIEDTNSESFADYWHCDQHPVDAMKIFISLHDLDESHGPLHVVRAEESAEISKEPFARHHHGVPGQYVEDRATVDTFTGPAGSVAFAKTNEILHRASNPAEGNYRDMIILYGYATDQPLPNDWFEQITPQFDKDMTASFGGDS